MALPRSTSGSAEKTKAASTILSTTVSTGSPTSATRTLFMDARSRSAAEYRRALEHVNANGGAALVSASLAEVNKMLIESERKLTNAEGLPNRPWFKHQLYAPGFYTGYGVKTVPAVREAIELIKWQQADEAIIVVAHVLQDEAALISSAAQKLSGSK